MRHLAFLPIVFFATLAALLLSSCTITYKESAEDKDTSTTKISIPCQSFNSIQSDVFDDISYVESDSFYVEIKGNKARAKNITLQVKDSILIIKNKTDNYSNTSEISTSEDGNTITINLGNDNVNYLNIIVHAPRLNYVINNSSCDFYAKKIDTDNFVYVANGSGDIKIDNLNANTVEVHQQGSSDAKMNIKAKIVSVEASGSSDNTMTLTDVDEIHYAIAGSGDADLNLKNCKKAEIAIAGSGDATLKGDVESFKQNVAGSGDININGLKIGK